MKTGTELGIQTLRIALVYMLAGLFLSAYAASTHSSVLASSQYYIFLLGWLSMALCGIIYYLFPACGKSPFALVHYWLHNVGLPVMIIGLLRQAYGYKQSGLIISVGLLIVLLGLLAFTWAFFMLQGRPRKPRIVAPIAPTRANQDNTNPVSASTQNTNQTN